jgi:ABC-type multidrug transport system ATPase subunit
VNDLHFSIPKNQCFGFLGVNGAGKSTTLKMLTGDEVPTQGDAYLGGLSITKDKVAVRRLMGYCPQHDAVHDLMTGEETLEFYGRLRGVPPHKLPAMVSYLAKRLTLDQDNQHKRPAGTYSGGNRRKLSVGIALIGNPPVVFLDEPSTGMDPLSRRFMWDFIASTMAERAVILTTHSMEECEALCSRIGILVHGRLRCIGPAQRLKDRYGNGFEFALTVQDGSVPAARAFVNDTFESVKEIECYGGSIKFQLGKQRVPLSAIFRLLEGNKDRVGILEYSIGQATLEQIFINMAAKGDREVAHEALGDVTRHKLAQLEEVKLEPMPERTSDELALPQSQSSKLNVLTRPQSQGSNGLPQEPALRLTETESDPAIVVPPVARSDSPTNSHPENI